MERAFCLRGPRTSACMLHRLGLKPPTTQTSPLIAKTPHKVKENQLAKAGQRQRNLCASPIAMQGHLSRDVVKVLSWERTVGTIAMAREICCLFKSSSAGAPFCFARCRQVQDTFPALVSVAVHGSCWFCTGINWHEVGII